MKLAPMRALPQGGTSLPLAIAGFLAPGLGLYAYLAIAPLFIIIGLWCAILLWRRKDKILLLSPPWLPLLLLALLAAISAFWAVDPPNTMRKSLTFAATLWAGAWILAAAQELDAWGARRAMLALAAGIGLAIVLLALEHAFGMQIMRAVAGLKNAPEDAIITSRNKLKNGAVVLAILSWPLVWSLYRMDLRRWAVLAFLAALGNLLMLPSMAALASFSSACAAAAACLAFRNDPAIIRRIAVGVILVVIAAPALGRLIPDPQRSFQWLWLPYSAHHRLTIWAFSSERALEKPIGGWGFDASRVIPGGSDIAVVERYNAVLDRLETSTEPLLPLHPHNGVLQIWVELGLVGMVLCACFLWARMRHLAELPNKTDRAFGAATVIAVLPVFTISYGAWQSWWLAVIIFAASFASAAARVAGSARSAPS